MDLSFIKVDYFHSNKWNEPVSIFEQFDSTLRKS